MEDIAIIKIFSASLLPTNSNLNLFCPVFKGSLWLSSLTMSHQLNFQISTPTKITSTFSLFYKEAKLISEVSDIHSELSSQAPFIVPCGVKYHILQFISHLAQEAFPNHSWFYSKTLIHIYCYVLRITAFCQIFLGKL